MRIAELIQLQNEESNINHHNQTLIDFLKSVTDAPGIISVLVLGVEGVS